MLIRLLPAVIAAIAFFLILPCAAQADANIQLLPPTYYGTGNPCVSASPNNQVLFLGGTGQNGQSAINCLTNGNTFAVNPTNGFVGIGNAVPQTSLDIAGPVRPVDAVTVCTATIGGALRYNSGTNIFEGCVNAGGVWQWLPLGRGASCNVPGGGAVLDGNIVAIEVGGPPPDGGSNQYFAAQCQNGSYAMIGGGGTGYPGTGVVIDERPASAPYPP